MPSVEQLLSMIPPGTLTLDRVSGRQFYPVNNGAVDAKPGSTTLSQVDSVVVDNEVELSTDPLFKLVDRRQFYRPSLM